MREVIPLSGVVCCMTEPCVRCQGSGTIPEENIIGDPVWAPCPNCTTEPAPSPLLDPTQDPPVGMDGECTMCGLPVIEARTLLEARREALSKVIKTRPEGITDADITEEDRAMVADFYRDACHAEWCEFDHDMLLFMVVRSRLNGRRSVT